MGLSTQWEDGMRRPENVHIFTHCHRELVYAIDQPVNIATRVLINQSHVSPQMPRDVPVSFFICCERPLVYESSIDSTSLWSNC